MQLDVRDTEYVWCVGKIKKIINQHGSQSKLLLIHYEGWSDFYDEFINENSNKLAPIGFFTSRKDIPKYNLSIQNNQMIQATVTMNNEENAINPLGQQNYITYYNFIQSIIQQ